MNGQKFVYRFVSYPDILKGDVLTRTEGADGGSGGALSLPDRSTHIPGDKDGKAAPDRGGGTPAQSKPSSRNDYIHSGLYTSFTLNSLQSGTQLFKSIKMENPGEKLAERNATQESPQPPTVIKFGTIHQNRTAQSPTERSEIQVQLGPMPTRTDSETKQTAFSHVVCAFVETPPVESTAPGFPLSGISPSLVTRSHSPSSSPTTDSQELVIDSEIESVSSQPSEIQLQVHLYIM